MAENRGLIDESAGSPIGEEEVEHLLATEDGAVIELVVE